MTETLKTTISAAALLLVLALTPVPAAEPDPVSLELDAYWAGISAAAAEGDFEAMAAAYHPDAVLVSEARGKSLPISEALAGWKAGIEETRRGEMSASVEFRFTGRLNDDTTAHQVGIFRYESGRPGGKSNVVYIHFEALLVKRDGWKMLMEYQQGEASESEWAAAGT